MISITNKGRDRKQTVIPANKSEQASQPNGFLINCQLIIKFSVNVIMITIAVMTRLRDTDSPFTALPPNFYFVRCVGSSYFRIRN